MWLAAQRRGVPCVTVRRSKISSGRLFFTADPMMFNLAARLRADQLREHNEPSTLGREYISSFRNKPRVLEHIQTKWNNKTSETWLAWHRNWLRSVLMKASRKIGGLQTGQVSNFRQLIDFNRREVYRRRHRHILKTFDETALRSMRYVLYPMHKETDLPLSYQAAAWFDQRNTVRLLASVMPNGYQLLIREHRRNYGLRPES